MKASERIHWAVALLDIRPDDRVLEIGCGSGVALGLVAALLKDGSITAVDRSEAMVRKAESKNSEWISAGRMQLLQSDLLSATLPLHHYDKIFAFNVNFFRNNPLPELEKVRNCLAPGGIFYFFFQLPPGQGEGALKSLAAHAVPEFEKAGFRVRRQVQDVVDFMPVTCIQVIAEG